MPKQNYEEYWKITLEYTDFNDKSFLTTLKMVVDKIDLLNHREIYYYNPKDYKDLQNKILDKIPKNITSTRKAINQCVKLGFVNPELQSYHKLTKDYLSAKTDRKRQTLFSKIVYSNSKFNRSTTDGTDGNQINFLIKTLEEIGVLTKKDIYALMLINIENHPIGYASFEELSYYRKIADEIGFLSRKYNQYSFLINILGKLEQIVFVRKPKKDFEIYFTEDAKRIFGEDLELESKKRDPYLHLLYKIQLFKESEEKYNKRICFLEKLDYPILIASHIKPFILSDENEAYDPNNGLLLSRTIDSLFDLRYISFTDEGKIIFSPRVSEDVKDFWKDYHLEPEILNNNRKKYLEFHRNSLIE